MAPTGLVEGPVTHRWDSSSPNTPLCSSFLAQPEGPVRELPLGEAEVDNISVQACIGGSCAGPVARQYEGDEVS